ncbi:BPTI/Kunitz domain-containing protein 4-like isoform X2 [Liolophura sinensis]|uniref:BPTI/Kunitz domain-containing protein 4-like isoform X2 n=1 Tax=Liolophura sinensis TaxID=3198878 RepID=UPI003158B6F1
MLETIFSTRSCSALIPIMQKIPLFVLLCLCGLLCVSGAILRCPAVCAIYCPNGNVLDHRGCPTCRCRTDPPPTCGPVCAIYCPNGNVLDHRGCPTCRCRPGPIYA